MNFDFTYWNWYQLQMIKPIRPVRPWPVRLEAVMHIKNRYFVPTESAMHCTGKKVPKNTFYLCLSLFKPFRSRSIFTINGMVKKWFVDFGPIQWINGKTPKFPINEPTLDIEITDETSAKVSDPVGNVLFCSWRSFELIVAHPKIANDENTNKLPKSYVYCSWF